VAFGRVVPAERRIHLAHLDVTVRVQQLGDGPTIVFVHGAANGGASWANLIPLLGGFRCLRGALESGRFTPEMFDWFLSLLRDTPSLRNELRSTPRAITPISGISPAMLLAPELLARVTMPVPSRPAM
jgi:pimeloyl-ACP methyl ester carboxylesterase